ncbi:MAG: CPCC family cysteine-rich protein [Pseudomonadota bacterium]
MKTRLFKCPCCHLPTLGERGGYEICGVCWWEDDGQDDPDAAQPLGGPNGHYSLKEARQNYRHHGHMYAEGEGILAVEKPSKARRDLMAFLAVQGDQEIDLEAFNQLLEDVVRRTNR